MRTILFLTVIGVILVAVGLTGLYFSVMSRLEALERDINRVENKSERNRNGLRNLADKVEKNAEKIYIINTDDKDLKYPNSEGL